MKKKKYINDIYCQKQFQKYKQSLKYFQSGLSDNKYKFTIDDDVIDVLIRDYAREPGVRGLEKCTKKITEKIAYRIMKQIEDNKEPDAVQIKQKDLAKILGLPQFSDFKFKDALPPGVVTGLAYTEYGGSLIFFEVS